MYIIFQQLSSDKSFWEYSWRIVSILIPICGLLQWRLQFVEKAYHKAAVKFLEKLSFLKGSIEDYRRDSFSPDEKKRKEELWEEVDRAYIDTNLALEILKVTIPGKKTKALENQYKKLIKIRIVKKIYGCHYSYCGKIKQKNCAGIISANDPEAISECWEIYKISKEDRPLNDTFERGKIYTYGDNHERYSFKEHVFNQEIFKGKFHSKNISDNDMVNEATEDIFGRLIEKYFNKVISQCHENFFITSSILLPAYKWFVRILKRFCMAQLFKHNS